MNWYRKYMVQIAQKEQGTFDFFEEKVPVKETIKPPEKKERQIELIGHNSYGHVEFSIDGVRYTFQSPNADFVKEIQSRSEYSLWKALKFAEDNYSKAWVVETDGTYRDLPDRS